MVKPEQLVASVYPNDDVSQPAAPELSDLEVVWEWDRKRETLLKLKDEEDVAPLEHPPAVSSQVWEAMRRLMDIVEKLRSPDSGWSENLPQTPENLLPYVIEEAYEVSDALKEVTPQPAIAGGSQFIRASALSSPSPYLLIEELSFRLLWYVARGSYELMQLLSGIDSRILLPDGDWQTGILRLVPILEVNASDIRWFLDLVTRQPPHSNLQPNTRIQLAVGDCDLQQLMQRLMQQIQATTPEAKRFTEKASIELLEPGKSWLSGEVRLTIDFEFLADDSNGVTDETATGSDTIVRPIDPAVIDAYYQGLLVPELSGAIIQLPTADRRDDGEEERSRLEAIVETATGLVNRCATHPFSSHFTNEINLDKWMPMLLWQLTGTSYDIMRLLGGVKAYILQPDWGWDVGTLRLLGILNLESTRSKIRFDLATGQPLKPSYFGLMNDTIVQLADSSFSRESERVETLMNQLIEPIYNSASALTLSLEGTTIELLEPHGNWQPGFVQLSLDLEFIPE